MANNLIKSSTKLRATLEIPAFTRRLACIGETGRLCLHCGAKISERRMRYGAKYCNDECKNKYRLNQLRKEAVSLRQTCMFCDEPISEKKKRYRALYCSDGCRNHAKIKRAQEKLEDTITDRQRQEELKREAWEIFDKSHPNVWSEIVTRTRHLINCGYDPLTGAVIEYWIRGIMGIKIPNAYKKFYREKFIREYPEYAHLFER